MAAEMLEEGGKEGAGRPDDNPEALARKACVRMLPASRCLLAVSPRMPADFLLHCS